MNENNKQNSTSPLLLGATRGSWLMPVNHGTELDTNKKLVSVRDKILKRDNYTCKYCGWHSERHQEIHHINHNHKDFKESNLATVCPLCHQVFHLSSASITEGAEIIWLPEMTQEDLNRLCIAIFIAEKSGNKKWEGPAKRLFNALNSRAEFVNNSLSDKASDPGVFAETLLNLSKEEYKGREKFVKNLRLLPFSSRFLTQIEYWSAACFKDIPLDDWLTIIPKEFNENK